MAGETFNAQKRAMALELFNDGFGCNAIAREVGVSPASISRWAKAEGLAFDRSQAALAVRAHTIDLAKERVLLAQKMAQAANDMLDMLDGPFTVFNFGGKDNTFASEELDAAPVDARRTIITASAIAFDKASKVVADEQDPGEAGAKAMLRQLGEALGIS
ncbi:helix-turn-helix domain-containing protein [Microbacterium sp. A8/3-1]|uniref:Helix-turn-helix domain-containing protein n=1 Tax=Microbacterium sp. A8/3-1 TaxID=3160749 RepID=A0AAU7VXW5_9MICO